MKSFQPTPHPILRIPTPAQASQLGYDRWSRVLQERERAIELEKADPLRHGYEPPSWKLADALMEWPWIDKAWAASVRKRLKIRERIWLLCINGGNRASKTEYAAKRTMQLLLWMNNARAWCFHSSEQNSREYQQPLLWKYLPQECRREVKSQVEYIAYTTKNGFSDGRFVLANGSDCSFRNYLQDIKLIEGGEVNVVWADEHLPASWLKTLKARIATRQGWLILTFTPTEGYTPCVALFQDGAECVLDQDAFLLPLDGGEPMPELAFQIDKQGYHTPHDPLNPAKLVVPGRKFDRVPRVLKSVEPTKAVTFFHTADNPYGGCLNVWDLYKADGKAKILERLYGVATKMMTTAFPKFRRAVHVVPSAKIPTKGTNYLLVDPASARNFFMVWLRFTKEAVYVVREWPGPYEVPGIGFLGPWAIPSDSKADGDRGEGQRSRGFGLKAYKEEIARLERWKDYVETREKGNGSKPVEDWDEQRGAEEVILRRFIDSRAASSPRIENDRPVTLLTDFDDIGLTFELTPGSDVKDGVQKINDWLHYDENQPISFFNKPRLYVSDQCPNTIYALENWTGADGQKGACKEPIDLLRYAGTLDLGFEEETDMATRGGGHW